MAEPASAVLDPSPPGPQSLFDRKMKKPTGKLGLLAFGIALVGGLAYAGYQLGHDLSKAPALSAWPYVLLGIALMIALAFEFVNGFHDTANAVATVIYTHSLEPGVAVVWSGIWNLIGVLTSSGGVAFSILALLPVELILQAGKGAGFAMIFALLIAAILWNLATWSLGLPASSSHTLIGSIIGVGLTNQLLNPHSGTSGVDWAQASNVFKALLISPLVGFGCSALLLLLMKYVIRDPRLFESPKGNQPPPFWIRSLLVVTCTGVSFGHGSNDGQKGMGLIMLILIGTVPTAYALNHAVGYSQVQDFAASSEQAIKVLNAHVDPGAVMGDPRSDLTEYIRTKKFTPNTMLSARQMVVEIENETRLYKTLAAVPPSQQTNIRNDMYVMSETLRLAQKKGDARFSPDEDATLANYKKHLDRSINFIPAWVKIAVALALGLGTMAGWRRIVVTIGEKIGTENLTYAQGVAAQIVAACTIIAANQFKMPVSTTHVLSSGVAGTMVASGSGLQWTTLRNIGAAWLLTLPAAALLSGCLLWVFRHFV